MGRRSCRRVQYELGLPIWSAGGSSGRDRPLLGGTRRRDATAGKARGSPHGLSAESANLRGPISVAQALPFSFGNSRQVIDIAKASSGNQSCRSCCRERAHTYRIRERVASMGGRNRGNVSCRLMEATAAEDLPIPRGIAVPVAITRRVAIAGVMGSFIIAIHVDPPR